MSYQKRITHIEGLVALGVAAERAGGKLTESHNGFHRNIVIGDVYIKVELRNYCGAVSENQPQGAVEAAFFDLGYIRQEGYRDSRKFSKRVAVNSKGVLDVGRLVAAIEKCVAAQAAHEELAEARDERAAKERDRQEQAEEKLAASPYFSQRKIWEDHPDSPTTTKCDLDEVVQFYTHGDGGVTLKLARMSPERAIEILEAISTNSEILG